MIINSIYRVSCSPSFSLIYRGYIVSYCITHLINKILVLLLLIIIFFFIIRY
ncbi:hypothetical protein HanIR_Chr04g0181661 [Helianthus annuus]|nr:hypothetical protein HanIR_Chr04g0181661 [Helianthus annuus]